MIEITGLTKRFGRLVALHQVNLGVSSRRISAIIGPNGSGKSTLIKCILGLVTPTSGSIAVNNILLDGDCSYRTSLGYMPQLAKFPQDLRVREVLEMVKGLRQEKPTGEDELIERFSLGPELEKRIRTLSGGTRQKVSLVIACLYDPELLILDEPTAGLDPLASSQLKQYVRALKEKGKTVLLTSHVMADLEELAEDIIFLLEGRVRFTGTLRDLRQSTGEIRLEAAVAHLMEVDAA